MSVPHVYFLLGAAGSGRRAIVADLVANGLEEGARPVVLLAAGEQPAAAEAGQAPAALGGAAMARWEAGGAGAEAVAEGTHVFVLADGRADPVEQIEAFQQWLARSGGRLARILTVVDCSLASAHKELLRWHDACVHFSDAVLLAKRDGVPNKWVSDFTARYRKQHFPCLIEMVAKAGVANAAAVLVPEARRMSMLFDSEAEWASFGAEAETEEQADAPDSDLIGAVDPYLEREAGSGRRVRELPDIAKFLPG
jgi:hypothetical protein